MANQDPFAYGGDTRVKTSGYTKIEDGETVRLRVTTNLFAYYTFQPQGEARPLKNNEVRELLEQRDVEDLFTDDTMTIRERYATVVWNYTTDNAEVWQFSRSVFDQLAALNQDGDWEGGLNTNDVKVTRTGKDMKTTYSIGYAPKSEPLSVEQETALLEVDVMRNVASARSLVG
jgi:hypothetical protein